MRERLAEVRAVEAGSCLHAYSALVLLDHIDFVTLWAEDLDPAASQLLAQTNRDALLVVTESPGACSELACQKLSEHL